MRRAGTGNPGVCSAIAGRISTTPCCRSMVAAEDLLQDLVFVDLETTGGSAAFDRIIEVGIVRVSNGEPVEEWSSLVNPERPIPAYIEAFTGISNEMVAGAPRFVEIAAAVREKLQGAVFVAHNARFDYSFLRSEFLKSDMSFSAKVLCTVKLSRRLFPEFARHNLDAVMERNGLSCDARHRALGDARVLHDFWVKLRRDVAEPRLAAAVQTVLGAHQLPAHLPPGLLDDLPDGPGAYRFFGDEDVLLYIGRSNSLRSRVSSHFGAEGADSLDRRLSRQVRRVDWVETAGELGAILREAEWIRTQKPLYNRRTKSKAQPHTLRGRASRTPAGEVYRLEAEGLDSVDFADLMQCFGVFRSEQDARKAQSDIARAPALPQGDGFGGRRGFVLCIPGREVQGRLRGQRTAHPAQHAAAAGLVIVEIENVAVSGTSGVARARSAGRRHAGVPAGRRLARRRSLDLSRDGADRRGTRRTQVPGIERRLRRRRLPDSGALFRQAPEARLARPPAYRTARFLKIPGRVAPARTIASAAAYNIARGLDARGAGGSVPERRLPPRAGACTRLI